MSPKSILIVENDGILCANMEKMLKAKGYEVMDTLASGEAALELVKGRQPDLIIMDIMLNGEMDGISTAQQIQKIADIPVIYLTAYAEETLIQQAIETGPYAYLVKPVQERELITTIAIALRRHSLEQKLRQTETALQQSEEKYRLLAENISDVIWTTDLDLNYTYISPSAEQISGYTVEEIMLLSAHDILSSSSLEQVKQVMQSELELEASGQAGPDRTITMELEQYRKDGSTVWIEIKASFLRRQDGAPYGILGITRDIDERKKAEEALRQFNTFLDSIIENIPSAVMIKDAEELKYIRINRAAEKLTGYSRTEVIGKTDYDFVPKKKADAFTGEDRQALEAKKMLVFPEETLVTSQRGLRIIHSRKTPILNKNNEPEYLLNITEDITERRQAEEKLKEEHKLRMKLLDNIPGCIALILQKETRQIVASNKAAREIGAVPGEKCYETCAKRDDECPFCLAPALWTTDELKETEVKYHGTWYLGIWAPLSKELYVHYIFDISKRKLAEQKLADYTLELEQLYHHLDEEINKARIVHERTLPTALPTVEGISFAAHYQPAQKMGGDLYDVIHKDNKVIFYLSDVSGHGLDGAMLSVFVKHTIKSYISITPADKLTPAKILRYLAGQFGREDYEEELYFCIFIAALDLDTHEFSYCGAGFQEELLLQLGNGDRLGLAARGMFITSYLPAEMLTLKDQSVFITPGTTIFLTTDGLTEQRAQGVYYRDRLPEVFYANAHLPPDQVAQAIMEDFREFNNGSLQGNDDITFLVLQVEAK